MLATAECDYGAGNSPSHRNDDLSFRVPRSEVTNCFWNLMQGVTLVDRGRDRAGFQQLDDGEEIFLVEANGEHPDRLTGRP